MSENLNLHLTDEMLNELLDQAVDRQARAAAEAHLANCRQCSARWAELRALFVSLASLPDRPPDHELAPGVMAAVRRHPRMTHAPATSARSKASNRRRPGVVAIFGTLQVLVALLLLAFAWPFLASFSFTLPVPSLIPAAAGVASGAQRITALLSDPQSVVSIAQGWLQDAAGEIVSARMRPLEHGAVGLGLAAAGAVWLIGNALLLGVRPRSKLRRNS